MSTPIRFGIVGLDHWYAAIPFAEKAASTEGAELYGIVDDDPVRAVEIAHRTGCDRTATDPTALISDPNVDVIACFTSVDRSADLCIAAAEAGKHIVSVKPVAMTLQDADRVVEAVERTGVHFLPSESRRTSPLARRLGELVHTGRLGALRSGTFAMQSSLPISWPGATDAGWWIDPDRVPGGGWLDHAVYQVDRMEWLFDEPITSVAGTTGRIAHPELAVEDYGHAVITLASGAVVTIEDTWIAPPGAFSNRGQLIGSDGAVQWDTSTGLLGTVIAGGEWSFVRMPTDTFDTFDRVMSAIRGDQPQSLVRDARRTLEICLAFYDAAKEASAVPVHP